MLFCLLAFKTSAAPVSGGRACRALAEQEAWPAIRAIPVVLVIRAVLVLAVLGVRAVLVVAAAMLVVMQTQAL
jgi:hypothetical protein